MADQDIRVARFFREHLTAAMIMTDLDFDLDGMNTVDEGIEYLSAARYDIAILRVDDSHKYVELRALKQCAEHGDGGSQVLRTRAKPFPSTRIVSSDLPIRSVASKLSENDFPLLVAGREGPEFILTRSDFSSPAGVAAALLLAALVDSLLDTKLQRFDPESVLVTLDKETTVAIQACFEEKKLWEEDLNILSLLHFDARLISFNSLHDPVCKTAETAWLVARRNDLAHGRHEKLKGEDLLRFVIEMDSIFIKLSDQSTT